MKDRYRFSGCIIGLLIILIYCLPVYAQENGIKPAGGGYAATGQLENVSYTTVLYGAENGLPTSDATCVLCASDGRIWIGGYAGVIVYDGMAFERLDSSGGLTSARALYEDKQGRIWVGTNDNGIVVLDGEEQIRYTYGDGLPSDSIRIFSEDSDGNVFAGTTAGLVYIDSVGKLHRLSHERLDKERIQKLDTDSKGRIYGQTADGLIFTIEKCSVKSVYSSEELGFESRISTIMTDPRIDGDVYIGTEAGELYHGAFGNKPEYMKKISLDGISDVQWLSYDCGRVFAVSVTTVGYLDESYHFHQLNSLRIDSGIEMMTSDYQGNLWFASSTQGVMKLVTNSFQDLNKSTELEAEATNAVCKMSGRIYVGTENGLKIIDRRGQRVENKLTRFIGNNRVRCIMKDSDDNLWISVYTGNVGLVCYSKGGYIRAYTKEIGMPGNEIRCTGELKDGTVIAGTNSGLAIIKNGKVTKTFGASQGMQNTVLLTVSEGDDGKIYAGSDGNGIYVIEGDRIEKIGREEGLTSEVILRIKKDEEKGVYWIITSNSMGYLKEGKIRTIRSFPYNNNYDIYCDQSGSLWILSSNGVYNVSEEAMLSDRVQDYRLYSLAEGLPYPFMQNSYSYMDAEGIIYAAGRQGVIKFNTLGKFEGNSAIKMDVSSVYSSETGYIREEDGLFRIPSEAGRIRIKASVMDYTMSDPKVRVFLQGLNDEGITEMKSRLIPLEYTEIPYGDYTLHIQILDENEKAVLQEKTYIVSKAPRIRELLIVKILGVITVVAMAGGLLWYFVNNTLVRRQYDTIRKAKEEVERTSNQNIQLIDEISHELYTPVNNILGMDEMILREDATDVPGEFYSSVSDYARNIRFSSAILLGLFDNLYEMTKIDFGKAQLSESDYSLSDLLRSLSTMERSICEVKGLSWDMVVDEIIPKRLYGDMFKLKAVVLNLLYEAARRVSEGRLVLEIAMKNRVDDECKLSFSVKISGAEMMEENITGLFQNTDDQRFPKANKEKTFGSPETPDGVLAGSKKPDADMPKFRRDQVSYDQKKNGESQRKYIEQRIIEKYSELLGGTVESKGIRGKEAEFVFEVSQRISDSAPIGKYMEMMKMKRKDVYAPMFIAPGAEILVADQDAMELNVVKGLVKGTKVFVTTVNSGEECLYMLKETGFDMVFLDQMLPYMDAFETVREIKSINPEMPVYVFTAEASLGEEYFRSKGFDGVIPKPIDGITLEKAIMSHLPEKMIKILSEEKTGV